MEIELWPLEASQKMAPPEHPASLKELIRRRSLRTGVPFLLLQEIKIEAHLLGVRLLNRFDPRMRARAAELMHVRNACLHFGCGTSILPGWINLDGWWREGVDYVCDLRARLPLADASCRLIYTEHVLEHIDRQFVPQVLGELRRVLTPSGSIRIVVPDCEKFALAYTRDDREWFRVAVPDCNSRGEGLNDIFRNHFHRFIYDFQSLEAALRAAGFVSIQRSQHRTSDIAELRVDQDEPSRVISNLYVEASRK
jgi:predicted SAM-dependent methyltransferase